MTKVTAQMSVSLDGDSAALRSPADPHDLAAGLLDELDLHIVPVLLGDGMRLFSARARARHPRGHRAHSGPRGRDFRSDPDPLRGGSRDKLEFDDCGADG